jgi:hypothetical protein
MATVIPYRRLVAARMVRVRGRITRSLLSIIRSTHELLFLFQELERALLRHHDHLVRLERHHDEAYRLVLRCQDIAALSDPDEMVRQRDAVVRQWAALQRRRA